MLHSQQESSSKLYLEKLNAFSGTRRPRIGKLLIARIPQQKNLSMRSTVGHEYPDVLFFWNALVGSPRRQLRVAQDEQVGNGESDRLNFGKDPPGKTYVFYGSVLCLGIHDQSKATAPFS